MDAVFDELEELEEPKPELLEVPKFEPELELEEPNFDPVFELEDPKFEELVPDPNLFWLELEELGLLDDPNDEPKDDDDDDDDEPNPVELCLFKLFPDELEPKDDDDDDPWLLDP